ncbi:exodeoxyribonuclease VII large subunit [Adlercreutzia sp. ZJ242]|uniref:exodeoxyribonuclease VII large subunit n=1 Tax=Adlercreutzia sp. ZJ242 TaxID=2709409 RepID=UPI0013ED265A|nr:exodeoxyribonuclease VII large subunit [Adlercreutzia sp. ZJ242]
MRSSERQEALSVSGAVALAKGALEGVVVRLVGEVSEVSNKPGYKAVYFTVKDRSASLPCMMWNSRYQAAGVQLRVGALVELTGRFTLYAAKGRMNFDVFSVTLAGEGNLRLQVAELARKLAAEGLTSPERKRLLPAYPQAVGLVTSPRGAAVHDVLRTLRRRWPLARVLLAGVPVEGAGAPAAIVEGMQRVVMAGAEVVLVVRGGGSFEDLMPFNDERLARAIADMPVPVVTGIGHEPDTSIADMVADVRASTPTYAAAGVAPEGAEVRARLDALASALAARERARVVASSRRVELMAALPLFREPMRLFEADARALDELSGRLHAALPQAIASDRRTLEGMRALLAGSLARLGEREGQRTRALEERLRYQGRALPQRFAGDVSMMAARLGDLSPLAVLARGYAIARDERGGVVKSVDDVRPSDAVELTVSDGVVNCKVVGTQRITTALEPWEDSDE